MSTQIDFARIVLLNRTKRELESANPVLLSGEASIADVGSVEPDLRFGDGVRPWTALPSFHARGIGGGIFAPFEVQNRINGHALFRVNDQIVPPGGSVISMGPGEVGGTGYSILSIGGNTNGTVFNVWGSHNTQPGHWLANFHGSGWEPGDPAIPPGYLGPVPGTSNGLKISAGTNANDIALLVRNDANGGLGTYTNFLVIRGDGSGYLGPDEENCFFWDTTGRFQTRGTARFPGDAISELRDVSLASLRVGDTLEWNGSMWANVAPQRGTVTRIDTGTGLTGGPIFETGTIELANTSVTPGNYKVANFTVDAQGRLTHAESGSLDDLVDLHITDPVEGQVLEFDGEHWVNADHHVPELATLPDVALGELHEGQILTWNGLHWTNGDPAHNLGELTNVLLTDPRPGEHLIFDGENWVNAAGASVTMGTLAPIDPEPGYLWWDTDSGQLFVWFDDGATGQWVIANNTKGGGGGASVTVDVTPPADPESGWLWWDSVGGQLYVWFDDGTSAQWVIANSGNGGGGGDGGNGGGGGLAQDKWGTYVISQSDLAVENWSPTLQVWGGDYAWALEVFESGAWGSPNFGNGLCIYTTNSGTQPALRVWDGSINGLAFQISNNGSGDIRPNGGVNRMYWDATGFYLPTGVGMPAPSNKLATIGYVDSATTSTLAGLSDVTLTAPTSNQLLTFDGTSWRNGGPVNVNAAFNVLTGVPAYFNGPVQLNGPTVTLLSGTISGLSMPIAFSIITAISEANTNMLVSITTPLIIPANLSGSRATCNYPTASSVVWTLNKVTRGSGNLLNWTPIGTISWDSSNISGVFSGAGGSFAVGDMLALSTPIDLNLRQVAVTIQAMRE